MAIMLSTVPTGYIPIGLKAENESRQAERPRAAQVGVTSSVASLNTAASLQTTSIAPVTLDTRVDTKVDTKTALQPRRLANTMRTEARAKKSTQLDEPQKQQFRRSLTQAGMMLLTEQFVVEVRKLIREQQNVVNMMSDNLPWALGQLYKSFCSVRTAARVLQYSNFETVAARGEVLVCLLNQGILKFEDKHLEILEDTLHLMDGIIQRVARDGHDRRCFSTARTALCLYAAAEPATQSYQPKATASPS